MAEAKPAPYLTFTGAADRKGLSEGAIRAAIARGELVPVPTACGRVKLLKVADVDKWQPRGSGRPAGSGKRTR